MKANNKDKLLTPEQFFIEKHGTDDYFACFHSTDMTSFARDYYIYTKTNETKLQR